VKEGWGFSWINVRYPDGRILNIQWLERGATAPGELPGELPGLRITQPCLSNFYGLPECSPRILCSDFIERLSIVYLTEEAPVF